jgi:hypothetical protein
MSSGDGPDGCYILSDRETSEIPEHGTGSLDLEENSACEEPGNTPTKNNKADITIDDITPRKQAKFQSPKGKQKVRKKKRNTQTKACIGSGVHQCQWEDNTSKVSRQ